MTLVNLTTMDRDMQNAYSRQASVEVEQQLGERSTVSVGYQYLRGRQPDHVGQPERAVVRRGRHQQRLPPESRPTRNNSQYSSAADSNYHGLHVSFVQRPARWGNYRVSYTLSKSMNNVGEIFFSSPIDPFDLSKDWGRSDDDQRHRLVVNGAVNTPMAPARTAWERLTHGFQVSGMLQAYSALPFNITSGVTTIQGTAGRPIVDGAFIERNAGVGSDFFSAEPAAQPRVPARPDACGSKGWLEAFNLTNRANDRDAEHELRRRRLSDEPVADVRAGDGGRRAEEPAIRAARPLLTRRGAGKAGGAGRAGGFSRRVPLQRRCIGWTNVIS